MYNRREFLRCATLLGVGATLPINYLIADDILMPKPAGDGLRTASYTKEIRRQKAPPRTITIPDVGEYKVLKGDFHQHTLFSDGHVMPKDRIAEAVDNGFDALALTDHIEYRPNIGGKVLKLANKNDDFNTTYNFALPEAEKSKLILVRGAEITKPEWHFNALFVKDINPIAAVVEDWKAMLTISVEQGGFNHWNHPSWLDRTPESGPVGLKSGEPLRFFDEIEEVRTKGLIHGVEVFNGSNHYPIALNWCNDRDLAPMANSDIHPSEWNAYGFQNLYRPMTLVFAKERNYESLREAFFAKRTIGWAANMIFGRQPWVEQLFRACVEIKADNNRLTLLNRSDIPCLFDISDTVHELPAKGKLELVSSSQKLTVCNWFVGTNKPLEIQVG